MVATGGGKQDGLHAHAEFLGRTGQKHVPHRLRARRTARFARHEHVMARPAKRIGKTPDLGGLASPLAAFECQDRKSVVSGRRVSVRVELGGRRISKKKKKKQ